MSLTTEPSAATRLSIYLNNHLAHETHAVELVKRASEENVGTRLGTFLELLGWELEEDRESLMALMGELGVRRTRVGPVFARIARTAGGLKFDRHSPLAELESIHMRINGKLDMWNALRAGVGNRVDGIDFDELIRRAERQAQALERRRLDVAANALSHRHGSAAAQLGSPPLAAAT
jgi:hypothetical protein